MLEDNYAELVKENARVICEVDAGKDELAKEKAKISTLEAELEATQKKVKFIAVDAILHARAKLMGEFKWGQLGSGPRDLDLGKEGGRAGQGRGGAIGRGR